MDVNKRLDKLERKIDEINEKLDILLSDERIEAGITIKAIGVAPSIKKTPGPSIPKKVDLTEMEKKIARLIYESGRDGISLRGISNNLQISTNECQEIASNIMKKKVPIESTRDPNKLYRFEQRVMEAQAKEDFLQLTKR